MFLRQMFWFPRMKLGKLQSFLEDYSSVTFYFTMTRGKITLWLEHNLHQRTQITARGKAIAEICFRDLPSQQWEHHCLPLETRRKQNTLTAGHYESKSEFSKLSDMNLAEF